MIIGLTGRNGSGKTTVGGILEKKGFIFFSLSDILRDELRKEGKDITRENLIQKGNELRANGGPGVLGTLAEEFMKKKNPRADFAIDSIRNPSEITELRKLKDFTLIGVSAPIATRLARMKENGRAEHINTEEEQRHMDAKEDSDDPASQQLGKCFDLKDHELVNDGPLDQIEAEIDHIIIKIKEKVKSDGWKG